MTQQFRVILVGSFHAHELYTFDGGREIYALDEAAEEAELQFGSDWKEVYNGFFGTSRDEWLGK